MMKKLMLSWESILESYAKFRDRGRCKRLIEQTATTFKFTGLTAVSQLSDISITIGALDIDKKKLIDDASAIALAVDAYQFNVCNTLTNPTLTKNMPPERLVQHTDNLIAAHGCLAFYSLAFEAFIRDPDGQRDNFKKSFDLLRDCFRNVVQQAQTLNEEQERERAISRILSSIGVEEKDQGHAQLVGYVTDYYNKLWSAENIEDQIRTDISNLHGRLTGLITQNDLNSRLPNGNNSSILEIADILMKHGVIWEGEKGREYAQIITDIGNRVSNGERITPEEFDQSDYRLAIPWFESELQRIQRQQRQQ